jgi:hypothetical protein
VANDSKEPRRGSSDAPETQEEAKDLHPGDPRLHPGGAHGSPVDPGMTSLHEEDLPSDPHQAH